MREISAQEISQAIKNLCIQANCVADESIKKALKSALEIEKSPVAKSVLECLIENGEIAKEKNMPLCQDTGLAVVFMEIGQDTHITGGDLTEAVNRGVAEGYTQGYLRASVVSDPFDRVNTKDNTPAIVHTSIVPGDKIKITVCPKGAGSENKSRVKMLIPAQGKEGVCDFVLETVRLAGADSCPPMIIGVGVGGNLETCALMAKKALCRDICVPNENEFLRKMEEELLYKINSLGIGPSGMGGQTTALRVNILSCPTHIAQLPVAVNISCHATRHKEAVL